MSSSSFDFQAASEKLDPQGTLQSIEQLGDQVQHIWELAQKVEFPPEYRDITNVVVCGMGGSVLGTHVIQTAFKDELEIPVVIAPDYTVPTFVNEKTLIIASSYSGTTEETLAAVKDAQAKGAKIAGITSGGPLAEFLQTHHYPALIFEATYNPAGTPRMALGYSIFGQMALFARAGLLKLSQAEYAAVLQVVAETHMKLSISIETDKNPAKLLAFQLLDRLPVVTVSEHLEGVGHVFSNQLNENAKTFAEYRAIPEINHHLMEGLQFPKSNEYTLFFVCAHSQLYESGNQRRFLLTEQVLQQNEVEYSVLDLQGKTKLEQAFELLLFGSYTSYYLALLHGQNPTPNPFVDWFKNELKKNTH